MKTLGTFTKGGFSCIVRKDGTGRVFYTADGDIDADGANGQNGAPAAYKDDDSGPEYPANGGMAVCSSKVFCKESWAEAAGHRRASRTREKAYSGSAFNAAIASL